MKQSEIITPFVESVQELCTTMLGCENLERGKIGIVGSQNDETELTAIIGMSGPDRATIALTFPEKTALKMVSSFMGMEMTEMDDDVADAVAEIVNIISGGAKSRLPSSDGQTFELGLPTVVQGKNYLIQSPPDAAWLDIPFSSDVGAFHIQVSFESMKKNKQ